LSGVRAGPLQAGDPSEIATHSQPCSIRRIRTKLKLSQRAAGALFKVGPNAFDKYERGLVEPSGPTVQLLVLLDRRPELVAELGAAAG
jgi:HTH-type transcriptional regulator/antitoxin MqsA